MRLSVVILIAVSAFALVRVSHEQLGRAQEVIEEPYAPSPGAAPFVTLGYREMGADVFWVRFRGYVATLDSTADGITALVDAIVTLDSTFKPIFAHGPRAMTMADHGVVQATYLHAIEVLERGMKQFPDDWKMPNLAGEIYTQDLVTTDPAQRRTWDEKGTLLIESAIRKPEAPPGSGTWVATMRTKLGQHERAVAGLRELLLVTRDEDARKVLFAKLAKLEDVNVDEITAEINAERYTFEAAWKRDRPAIPQTPYVLLGPRIPPTFDMTDLATGGRDLTAETVEHLEPPTDPAPPTP